MHSSRAGGRILVDQLLIHGADMAFCVPGESYLPVLDALYDVRDRLKLVSCRQEGGAANMAEAYGKLTGRPGICLVTRGPGACNASIGVHTAFQDSTPMILFVGQVGSDVKDREGFQEVDFTRMFAPLAKWSAQIDRTDRIPEYVARAFAVATSGRAGPVVLALPEDVLSNEASVADAQHYQPIASHPGGRELGELRQWLKESRRPLVLLGGSGWSAAGVASLEAFALLAQLPVACAFRFQDLFDNAHHNYVGDVGIGVNPKLAQRVRDADLLLVIGARLGEMTTSGYTLLDVPTPKQKLVHVHADANELGRVYQPALAINAGLDDFAHALAGLGTIDGGAWRDWLHAARADYLAWLEPQAQPGELNLGECVAWLRQHLARDAIVTNGAGNYTAWLHRHYQYRAFRSQLAPTSGAMGYGVPSAVAARLVHPGRTVVSFNGDGCFMMNGQELATAVQYQANVIFIVVNNGMYGTIRMHQEKHYPDRVIATDLRNPDFVALAHAYGAHGERVARTADFPQAFLRALNAGKPALIELVIDREAITPRATLSALRGRA